MNGNLVQGILSGVQACVVSFCSYLLAQDSPVLPDSVERVGAMGLLTLVLWWVLKRQADAIDRLAEQISKLSEKISGGIDGKGN